MSSETKQDGLDLTWEEAESLWKAYKELHVKGVDALIACAENMVKLDTAVRAYRTARENVFSGKVGVGQNAIANTHPRFAEVAEELDGLRKRTCTVVGLVPVKRSDLEVQNAAAGSQELIATLMRHGLLQK